VNARLVYAGTDTVVWDRTFEARAADVFALRADIVKAVTDGIHARLGTPVRSRGAQSFEAFDLYLKGRYYWNQRTEQGLKQSVQYFQAALQQSPDYALAYAGMADAYNLLGFYGYLPVGEAHDLAAAAADHALALDDTVAEAYASRGFLHESRFEWDLAEDSYRRAIGLNPGYATAHHWYGYLLSERGRAAEAVDQMAKAVDLDPLSAIVNAAYGSVLIFARRYDDAIAQLQRTVLLDGNLPRPRVELANALLHKGDMPGALQAADQAAAVAGRDATVRGDIGYIDAMAGRRSDAIAIAGELADRYNQGELSAAMPLAIVYAGLGSFDDAFTWMDRARQEYASDIGGMMVDPRLDPLRSDPRYGKLLAAVGLAQ
jgi:Tfp pilus assembly protein PilF